MEPDYATTHVKMHAFNESGAWENAVAKADDGYTIGMFINRWLQRECTEIKLTPCE